MRWGTKFRNIAQSIKRWFKARMEITKVDVTVRFSALGMEFLVLIECNHHKNRIKREVLQVLQSPRHAGVFHFYNPHKGV